MAISLCGLCFEWRKAYMKAPGAKSTFGRDLKRLALALGIGSCALAAFALTAYRNETAIHKTLIFHKPWMVQYGNVLDDGKNRIYVHARFNNTSDYPVKFQVYGKALIEPLSLTRAQSDKISDKLKDDIRLSASGDDAPVLTASPRDDQSPTIFDIPGPAVTSEDFSEWRKGKNLVYLAVLVYVKEEDETRFAFRDCEIKRAVVKLTSAGTIPGLGPISVKYPWIGDTPCDETRKP